MDKWEYVSLYMHRKLVSSHHRALALAELEAEWEYAKPRPNPARKQLAALKAAAREYITYNGGDGDDITCRISIGRLVKLAKLLGVDPLIEGGV